MRNGALIVFLSLAIACSSGRGGGKDKRKDPAGGGHVAGAAPGAQPHAGSRPPQEREPDRRPGESGRPEESSRPGESGRPARNDIRVHPPKFPRVIGKGQSAPLTGEVTGTTAPVRIRIKNTRPEIGRLEGGDDQVVVTSGGTPNIWTRSLTGVAEGTFAIDAEAAEPKNGSGTPPEVIAAEFQRTLSRVAAALENAIEALPVHDPPGRRGPVLWRSDVLDLIRKTREDLRTALPYPELTAFHDAVAELVRTTEREVNAAIVGNVPREYAGSIFLAQTRGEPVVKAGPVKKVLYYFASVFGGVSKTSPLGTICILTRPQAGASVMLHPASDSTEPQEITSASQLTLYLGRYKYLVTKHPYPASTGYVDLLLNPQRVLECPVRRTTTDSQACRLLSRSVEPCR